MKDIEKKISIDIYNLRKVSLLSMAFISDDAVKQHCDATSKQHYEAASNITMRKGDCKHLLKEGTKG